MKIVYPSGAARAASAPPRLPPAPGLLSTVTVWPKILLSSLAVEREAMSTAPAGGKGQISRIGLVGNACAAALKGKAEAKTDAAKTDAARTNADRRGTGDLSR